jgi:anti-sigma regulatory factor (Ser/Thr protein kinase)
MPSRTLPSRLDEQAAQRPLAAPFGSREMCLRPDPSELAAARDYVEQAAVAFGLDRARGFACVFAVNEALTNAIRYGAPGEDERIRLRISAERDRLVFAVSSRGPFAAARASRGPSGPAAEVTSVPGVSSEGGRGLPYMERLMDEVELDVRAESTTVRLYKRLRLAAGAQARPPGTPS